MLLGAVVIADAAFYDEPGGPKNSLSDSFREVYEPVTKSDLVITRDAVFQHAEREATAGDWELIRAAAATSKSTTRKFHFKV